ncbi:MAG: Fe2+-dependent dioxygenase [Sphingomonadales bacterium]|nr:Fe2+-dependent dioxygenase [Sphingomonadales bacterium]
MLIAIADVLSTGEAQALRERLLAADWIDGNATSGAGSALAKRNRQLPVDAPATIEGQRIVQRALSTNGSFLSAAVPHTVFPPLFNRYGVEERFGAHVDNAIRIDRASGVRIRTDLAATLFLTDPADYDGGELTVEGAFGSQSYKLPHGHMLLYPASSLHRVEPVTRGERLSCFFWVQSMIASAEERSMLYDLDQSIQALSAARGGDDDEVLRLTGVYHNLIRRFAIV